MIPKILHYIWLGNNKLPEIQIKCIDSWKKHMPEYEFRLWNESNLNLDLTPDVRKNYNRERYGFCVDPLRMQIIYEFGGIYLDTDVMLLQSLEQHIGQAEIFFVKAHSKRINSGLGFGATPGHPLILELLNCYVQDKEPIGMVCSIRETQWLSEMNITFTSNQTEMIRNVLFISSDLMNPNLLYGRPVINQDTISIHYQTQGWRHPLIKKINNTEAKIANRVYWITENKMIQSFSRWLIIKPIRFFFLLFKRFLKLFLSY